MLKRTISEKCQPFWILFFYQYSYFLTYFFSFCLGSQAFSAFFYLHAFLERITGIKVSTPSQLEQAAKTVCQMTYSKVMSLISRTIYIYLLVVMWQVLHYVYFMFSDVILMFYFWGLLFH